MRKKFSEEEMESILAGVEIAFDEHGLKCDDGHWMTDEEFSKLSDVQIIHLFETIYERA